MTVRGPFRLLGILFSLLGLGLALLGACLYALLAADEGLPALLALGINGGVFVAVGAVFVAVDARARRLRSDMLAHGERVEAEIIGFETNPNMRVNGHLTQRLVCRYVEGGVTYVCRSDDLRGYPVLRAKTVTVCRDPQNIKRYYVDLEGALEPSVDL